MLGRGKGDTNSNPKAGPDERRRGPGREERRVAAWIGPSIVITGSLKSSEDMTIAGRVEGDVAVPKNTVTIAPRARIDGNIVARSVQVHGELRGDITADRSVEVGETGSVVGKVITPRMSVSEGAVLNGPIEITRSGTGSS